MQRFSIAVLAMLVVAGFCSQGLAYSNDLTLAEPLKMDAAGGSSDTGMFAESGEGYRGGRGTITLQGMTGMFLNPTSGTLDQGQAVVMYCLIVHEYNLTGDSRIIGHGLMFDYGVTDWLNVGAFVNLVDAPGFRSWCNDPLLIGGPFVRVRVLKDAGGMPEVSVGAIYLDGDDAESDSLSRLDTFVAGSKLFDLDREGTFRSLRVHGGARYLCFPEIGVSNTSFLYTGLELELPQSIYVVGEVMTDDLYESAFDNPGYSIGVQWKPNQVVGLSIAHIDPAGAGLNESFWFGIGLNFGK